jgi:hypothetical protein
LFLLQANDFMLIEFVCLHLQMHFVQCLMVVIGWVYTKLTHWIKLSLPKRSSPKKWRYCKECFLYLLKSVVQNKKTSSLTSLVLLSYIISSNVLIFVLFQPPDNFYWKRGCWVEWWIWIEVFNHKRLYFNWKQKMVDLYHWCTNVFYRICMTGEGCKGHRDPKY